MNYKEFYNNIYSLGGISAIWSKILDMIKDLYKDELSDDALKVICIYFSLIDDGNTCVCLDKDVLWTKWKTKYNGLVVAAGEGSDVELNNLDNGFIKEGIDCIIKKNDTLKQLFKVESRHDKRWLFIAKYAVAVEKVSNRLKELLSSVEHDCTDEEKIKVISRFKNGSFKLNNEQAEAIVRGVRGENLIISGGPGMGKTTVVCYLLWQLLESGGFDDYTIYLAAPSGKAQDRLRQAITEEVEKIVVGDENEIKARLKATQSYTIHRLLSFNPSTNTFSYNENNQFPQKSIFIIDEASMVDICLFQSLLEAIPKGARLFILGDPYQLPSVQAGAVLGDVLQKLKNNKVELTVSNRFNADSVIGHLSANIKKFADNKDLRDFDMVPDFMEWESWKKNKTEMFSDPDRVQYPVEYIKIKDKQDIEEITIAWANKFYNYNGRFNLKNNVTRDELDCLWAFVEKSKILCAERNGRVGVKKINDLMSKRVSGRNIVPNSFFPGQQLIITQNQKIYDLYNGDCGVVACFENVPTFFFMTKKPKKETDKSSNNTNDDCYISKGEIRRIDDYIFYPLHVIPSDSIETAFAITIHKSQGSGYDNIMVFIPEKQGHPLLNNQIIYTAITRTKGNTYIIGSKERMQEAMTTCIKRDTLIDL